MCLEVIAIPSEPGSVSARALSEISGLTVTKGMPHMEAAFHFAREHGCSCSLLSDDADWNGETWSLDPGVLDGLARAVELIAERTKGLAFQALWIGDAAETQDWVPLKELVRDIQRNAIKNKHRYLIGRAGQQ